MTTKVLTSSQLTFVDITDRRKLSVYLTSNLPTVQKLDSGVYNPSWKTSNLVITPQVFIDQTPLLLTNTNLQITWKCKDGNNTETDLRSGELVEDNVLTVSENNLGPSASGMLTYICQVQYYDSETGQTVNITDQMTYTLIKAAENAKTCFISGPQVFKYDKNNTCTSDTQIMLNATVQNVTITQWQYYDPNEKTYKAYPTTDDNTSIISATLNVKNTHPVFDSSGVAKIKLVTSDSNVYDVITITKIYDGQKGDTGSTGASAYTFFLTNESHIFPGTTNSAKVSNVTTQVICYQGTTKKKVRITSVDGIAVEPKVHNKTQTDGLYSYIGEGGDAVKFYAYNELTAPSGSIPIVFEVDGISSTKSFSWSVSYTGSGACSLHIEASSQIFKSNDGVNYTPETITLTPHVQNLLLSNVAWKYSVNGGNTWTDITNTSTSTTDVYYNDTTKVLTIPKGFDRYSSSITSIVFRCTNKVGNESYTDSITVARLSDGQSASAAYTVILSNEMQGISTNSNLVPLSESSFECAVTVYEGSTQLTATNSTVGEGTFKVVLPETNPTGITLGQTVPGQVTFSVSNEQPISSTGAIDLTIQIESETNVVVKSVSYVASKSGIDGNSPVTFMVWAPNGDVFSNQTGELPLSALAYEGTTEITSSDAEFKWYKYTNGEYMTIEGATDTTYTVSGSDVSNIQTYKCEMTYKEKTYSGVYTMEDKSDTYISEMLTIGGTTFKNGQGGSVVYIVVRSNGVEKDPFPVNCVISTNAPSEPKTGDYWWDTSTNPVQLMKHNGITWAVAEDDPQQFDYTWSLMDKDGNATDFKNKDGTTESTKKGKVIYLSCNDINSIGTLQCDVHTKPTTNSDATTDSD